MTTSEPINSAAHAAARAGHDLAETVFNSLPDAGRTRWLELALAGADVALTVKWTSDKHVEIRLSLLLGDGEPETVLALEWNPGPDTAPSGVV